MSNVMSTENLMHPELETAILKLDPTLHDCRLKIADLRRQMDEAFDQGKISIVQWRALLDRVAAVQSRCVPHVPISTSLLHDLGGGQ